MIAAQVAKAIKGLKESPEPLAWASGQGERTDDIVLTFSAPRPAVDGGDTNMWESVESRIVPDLTTALRRTGQTLVQLDIVSAFLRKEENNADDTYEYILTLTVNALYE